MTFESTNDTEWVVQQGCLLFEVRWQPHRVLGQSAADVGVVGRGGQPNPETYRLRSFKYRHSILWAQWGISPVR
jgi:hypothetical protein